MKMELCFTFKGKAIKSIKKSFNTACKKVGIEDFRIHDEIILLLVTLFRIASA